MSIRTAFSLVIAMILMGSRANGVELFPAPGAKDVCPDATLRIVFDSPPAMGDRGKIQIFDSSDDTAVETIDVSSPISTQAIGGLPNFKYYPVIISGNKAEIHPRNGALTYNKTYYVKIDSGAFSEDKDAFPGMAKTTDWSFTTKASAAAVGASKITVAADGTGDFCSVQGAIDSIPAGSTAPVTIFIRRGTYTELIYFTDKHSLTFQGEDRKDTVIAYANNNKFNSAGDNHTYHRGVFLASKCNDLVITNLTIRNTTPQGGSQAEAIILKGNPKSQAVLKNVNLYSYQDTLQINGQAYIADCYIEGDVDFLWGSGPCFFENCRFNGLRSGGYYTQIRNPATNHGYVFYRCTFDGPEGVKNMFLSRIAPSAFPASEVVLIDCVLGDSVNEIGWRLDGVKGKATQPVAAPGADVHFWEFNSHKSDGRPIDTSKRLSVSRQLQQPADAEVIANYSNPTFVLGNNWNPRKN